MKNKETLEEAALKYASEKLQRVIIPYKELNANVAEYVGFINGAKWQQDKSKQNRLIADEVLQFQFSKPKMYSEEDMKSAYEQGVRLALLSQSPLALHKGEFPNPEEWFNDFKKENNIWK